MRRRLSTSLRSAELHLEASGSRSRSRASAPSPRARPCRGVTARRGTVEGSSPNSFQTGRPSRLPIQSCSAIRPPRAPRVAHRARGRDATRSRRARTDRRPAAAPRFERGFDQRLGSRRSSATGDASPMPVDPVVLDPHQRVVVTLAATVGDAEFEGGRRGRALIPRGARCLPGARAASTASASGMRSEADRIGGREPGLPARLPPRLRAPRTRRAPSVLSATPTTALGAPKPPPVRRPAPVRESGMSGSASDSRSGIGGAPHALATRMMAQHQRARAGAVQQRPSVTPE